MTGSRSSSSSASPSVPGSSRIPFEAIDELEKDSVITEALGDHVFSHYIEAKRAEWDEYRTQVSDWEVDRYLEQF